MMRISCPSCGTGQELEIEAGVGAAKAKCGACGTSFLVRVKSRGKSGGSGAPLFNWYVRKPDGVLLSFPGDAQLHDAIQKGAVDTRDEISADGRSWSQISGLPILRAFMERWSRSESGSFGVISPGVAQAAATGAMDLEDTREEPTRKVAAGREERQDVGGSERADAEGPRTPTVAEGPRAPTVAEGRRAPIGAEGDEPQTSAEGQKTGVWSAAEMAAAAAALRPGGPAAESRSVSSPPADRRPVEGSAWDLDDSNKTMLGSPQVPPEIPKGFGGGPERGGARRGTTRSSGQEDSPWSEPWGPSPGEAPLPPTRVEQPAAKGVVRDVGSSGAQDSRPLVTGVGFPAESGEPAPVIQPVAVAPEVRLPPVDVGEEEWERALAVPEYSEETGQILLHPGGRKRWRWGLVGGLVIAGILTGILVGRSCGRSEEESTGKASAPAVEGQPATEPAAGAKGAGDSDASGSAQKLSGAGLEDVEVRTAVETGEKQAGEVPEKAGAPEESGEQPGPAVEPGEGSGTPEPGATGTESLADVREGSEAAPGDTADSGTATTAAVAPEAASSSGALPMPSLRREPIKRDSPAAPAAEVAPAAERPAASKVRTETEAKPARVARQAETARAREGDGRRSEDVPEPVVRGGDFETLMARGNKAYKARRYGEATAHFRKATEANARNPVGHHKLGDSLMQTGKLDEAMQAYEQAVDLTGYAPAYMGMARALERKGQVAKAIAILESALEQHSGHSEILRLLESLKGR